MLGPILIEAPASRANLKALRRCQQKLAAAGVRALLREHRSNATRNTTIVIQLPTHPSK